MTEGFNDKQYKIVNILAWILITIMLGYGAWLGNKFYDLKESLPHEYVRLERYTCDIRKVEDRRSADIRKVENRLERIEDKLDRVIERQSKKNR